VDDGQLMSIGRFARVSGLSIHALRHYDDVGLLTPAEVDAASGYRRYRSSQIRSARLIQSLRWIDLPPPSGPRRSAGPLLHAAAVARS